MVCDGEVYIGILHRIPHSLGKTCALSICKACLCRRVWLCVHVERPLGVYRSK